MNNLDNSETPHSDDVSENESFLERHKADQHNLSPEEQDKLKRGNRKIIFGTVILGILMLGLGLLAGKNLADSRDDSAPLLPAAVELSVEKEGTINVR